MSTENKDNLSENGTIIADGLANFNIPAKGNVETKEDDEEEVKDDKPLEDGLEDEEISQEEKDKLKEEEEKNKKPVEKEEQVEGSIISLIAEKFAEFELEGEVEDTEEGLITVTQQLVDKSREAGKREAIEEEYTKNPLLKIVKDHLNDGGSLLSLIQQKQVEDFSKVVIADDDLSTAEKMYRIYLESKGNDEDEIEQLVNSAKDNGVIVKKGQASKDFLVESQKKIVDAQIESEKKERLEELKELKELQDNIKSIISDKKINGLEISKEVANKLEDFLFTVDNKGRTKRDIKWEEATTEQKLLIDLMLMEDFKPLTGIKVESTSKPLKLKIKPSKQTLNLNTTGKGGSTSGISKLGIDKLQDLFQTPQQ